MGVWDYISWNCCLEWPHVYPQDDERINDGRSLNYDDNGGDDDDRNNRKENPTYSEKRLSQYQFDS